MSDPAVLDPAALLSVYDRQLRALVPDPPPDGLRVERDGPLLRFVGDGRRGFVTYVDLGGVAGAELDALIARQRDFFAARGEAVEWKLHGHDRPADLAERLAGAGFVPEPLETVVIGPVAGLAAALPVLPEGVRLREVTARADLDRIADLEAQVWSTDRGWLADGLAREIAADPRSLTVVVAEHSGSAAAEHRGAGVREEHGDVVVSAGWVRYVAGTAFATLWGGATLPQWRRRGVYRALLTHRARLAGAQGFTLLQVDASDESRPILQRLGFVAVTTTTPYVYTP
jgi:ribosomal protein S18 acetylase RimI-like enzyme